MTTAHTGLVRRRSRKLCLAGVLPETPIWDIVDQCRVWESHADTGARRIVKPARAQPVYMVNEPVSMLADQVVATVIVPPVGPGDLEALLRCLLPTAPVQTPPPRPVPTEMEILLERLLSEVPALTPPPRTGIMGMETLLKRLLLGTPAPASRLRLGPACTGDWTTIVCFSCGKPGHGWPGARNWMKHSSTCCWDGRQRRWAPIT